MGWWEDGEVCEDCLFSNCSMHKPGNSRSVFVTSGGSAYHYDINCASLDSGQAHVAARGGVPAHKETMTLARAKSDLRQPCARCVN